MWNTGMKQILVVVGSAVAAERYRRDAYRVYDCLPVNNCNVGTGARNEWCGLSLRLFAW